MNLSEKIARMRISMENHLLDSLYGISTAGTIEAKDLRTDSRFHANSSPYQPAWYQSIRFLIREGARLGWGGGTFVDIGCGKGRACFFAAKTGLFSKVIGIDFDANLIREANANLASFRGRRNIKFIEADATEHLLAEEKSFIFMFNPFDSVVMDKFISNNSAALQHSLIAYSNDLETDCLIRHNLRCRFRSEKRRLSLWAHGKPADEGLSGKVPAPASRPCRDGGVPVGQSVDSTANTTAS